MKYSYLLTSENDEVIGIFDDPKQAHESLELSLGALCSFGETDSPYQWMQCTVGEKVYYLNEVRHFQTSTNEL